MPSFNVRMRRTASATLSVGAVIADATVPRRALIFRAVFGSDAAPADASFLWELQRCTTVGTATGVTPQALDPGSPAAIDDGYENYTVDPTLTANAFMLSVPMHQRATYPFFATPGREIVIPGTANNGIAVRTPVANAVAVTADVQFEE